MLFFWLSEDLIQKTSLFLLFKISLRRLANFSVHLRPIKREYMNLPFTLGILLSLITLSCVGSKMQKKYARLS